MHKFLILVLGVTMSFALLGASVLADVGVGVGTGKIDVKQNLKSGGIYILPAITVYNTGTEEAVYSMSLTLNERQDEIKPEASWLSFSPSSFTLKPNQTKVVTPKLTLPVNAKPGKYFGYLEAHPDQTVKKGTTKVGVAAATKLSFTVVPSNVFLSIAFRAHSLYSQYKPWTQLATFAIIFAIIYKVFRKKFNIQISKN